MVRLDSKLHIIEGKMCTVVLLPGVYSLLILQSYWFTYKDSFRANVAHLLTRKKETWPEKISLSLYFYHLNAKNGLASI